MIQDYNKFLPGVSGALRAGGLAYVRHRLFAFFLEGECPHEPLHIRLLSEGRGLSRLCGTPVEP